MIVDLLCLPFIRLMFFALIQKKLHFQPHPFKILIKADPTFVSTWKGLAENFNIRADHRGEAIFAI